MERTRALIWVYMIKGARPNGATSPTTDDVHAGISGGTLFDVSVGIARNSGSIVCDVCAVGLNDKAADGSWACQHVPGETRKMTDRERERQVARGVPGGKASYSIVDATPNEVSVVHSGAVPSAGFSMSALRGAA